MRENEYSLLLGHYAQYLPEKSENNNTVSIGCGIFDESSEVKDVFGGTVVGVDSYRNDIVSAEKYIKEDRISVVAANAEDVRSYVRESIDVVLFRHPPFHENGFNQNKIVRKLKPQIKPDGVILMSFFTQDELNTARKLMEKNGFKIVIAEKSPLVAEKIKRLQLHDVGIDDGYVLIARNNSERTKIQNLLSDFLYGIQSIKGHL